MKIELPTHRFTIEPSSEWQLDESESPEQRDTLGIYLRSVVRGMYFNVRAQTVDGHPLTREGLLSFLREQEWASPPFDEWSETFGALVLVGATFEMTADRSGEVVMEVFVTDGHLVANLAAPGDRAAMRAAAAEVRALATTISFV